MSDFLPETQSSGSLEPPRRLPPAAVGVRMPEPYGRRRPTIPSPEEVLVPIFRAVAVAVRAALARR